MRFTASLAVGIALLSQLAAASAAPNVPTVDIKGTCRAAAGAMVSLMGGSSLERDIEVCLSSEQTARQQLVKDWDTYSAQDRGRCIRPDVYLPSYVEWLTCLDMERDVRKMKIDQPDPGGRGIVTLPIVRPRPLW
jgi:hypothetical protein